MYSTLYLTLIAGRNIELTKRDFSSRAHRAYVYTCILYIIHCNPCVGQVFFALSFICMVAHTVHAMLCERRLRLSNPHGTFRMTPLQQLAGKEDFTP